MRGYTYRIDPQGLRPVDIGLGNSNFLTEAFDVRMREKVCEYYGGNLTAFPTLTVGATTIDMTIAWPYPQIFQHDTGIWIANKNHLYQLQYTTGAWTLNDRLSGYTDHNVTWPWSFADVPGNPVFASGNVMVWYDRTDTAWKIYDKNTTGHTTPGSNWSSDWYPPVSACGFRGQTVVCGSRTATTFPSQSRLIRWSEIGRFAFLGKTADSKFRSAGEFYAGRDDNEVLLKCLPLHTGVMVYGTFGSYFLYPVDEIFGIREVPEIGISNPLAAGGDLDMHLVVDRAGHLWTVTPDYNIRNKVVTKDLRYENFLYSLVDNSDIATAAGLVSVIFNRAEKEFYISDGTDSYLFNADGLTEISKVVTGILDTKEAVLTRSGLFSDKVYGSFSTSASAGTVIVTSEVFDFGLNGLKSIEAVALDLGMTTLVTEATAEVMIQWRNTRYGSFSTTSYVRADPMGMAYPLVTALEFKVTVRLTDISAADLGGIRIFYKVGDERYGRSDARAAIGEQGSDF